MNDQGIKERARWAIVRVVQDRGLTNKTIAPLVGVSSVTVNNYRTKNRYPKSSFIKEFCKAFGFNEGWFYTGQGEPFPGARAKYPEVCGPEVQPLPPPGAIPPPPHPAASILPAPDYGDTGIDPVIQAMSDIKDIFNSGDPILIPAIQANLNAFKRALLREQQFAQVIQENRELKERIAKLEALCGRIPELEAEIASLRAENKALREENELIRQENKALRTDINRLKATYENPGTGDGSLTAIEDQAM
jgi:regulator of replication initiation timing